jgi:hypothetical protein
VTVGGKTGTAQKADGGRYVARYVASFAGFAPVDSPRLVCLVVLDEPRGHHHWGGYSAATTFRRIMQAIASTTDYLQPPPERITVVRAEDLKTFEERHEHSRRLATVGGVVTWPDWRGVRALLASP